MEEARRFIRYVIPGLATVLQVLAACWSLWPEDTLHFLKAFKDPIAVVGGGLLASAALGYLLSIVYYWTCWPGAWMRLRWLAPESLALDHRIAFWHLNPGTPLGLEKPEHGPDRQWLAGDVRESLEDAWEVTTLIWLGRGGDNDQDKSIPDEIRKRVQTLTDVMNGHGTTLVGSGLALIGVAVAFLQSSSSDSVTGLPYAVAVVWLAFLTVQWLNFRFFKRQVELLIATAILTVLRGHLRSLPGGA